VTPPLHNEGGDPHDEDDDEARARMTWFAAAAFAVIAGLGLWLAHALHENLELQKCQLEGRRDCIPIEIPGR
jgi:hypothetical protein